MREIYFNDQIDNAEYNGKLYGLGQTCGMTAGLSRENHNQTVSQNSAMGIGMGSLPAPALGSSIPTPLSSATPYGSLGANGSYIMQ